MLRTITLRKSTKDDQCRNKHLAVIVLASICALLMACLTASAGIMTSCAQQSVPKNTSPKVSYTDSCGRTVEVPSEISRIAVTGPPAQNFVLTFAPDMLVGLAAELSDAQKEVFGQKVASLPVLGQVYGNKGTVDKEQLATLQPDVIIDVGNPKSTIVEDMNKLQEQVSIPCVHIDSALSTYDQTYLMLGKLLNMPDKAQTMADYCKKAYAGVSAALGGVNKLGGLYLTEKSGTNVVAKGTSHSEVIDMCTNNLAVLNDGTNLGTGNETNIEQISNWNPDVIVFEYEDAANKAKTSSEWSGINAVKNGKIYVTPTYPYEWMGKPPSVAQLMGVQWLTNLLYPSQYNVDIKQVTKDFYKLFYNYDLTDEKYSEITQNAH